MFGTLYIQGFVDVCIGTVPPGDPTAGLNGLAPLPTTAFQTAWGALVALVGKLSPVGAFVGEKSRVVAGKVFEKLTSEKVIVSVVLAGGG